MPNFFQIYPNLYVGSFPESFQQGIEFDIVINVSDTVCNSFDVESPSFHKKPLHFWVPVLEWGIWPYSAFYAVKKILDKFQGKRLIHCHGGVCRSITMALAWLYSNNKDFVSSKLETQWAMFLEGKGYDKAPPSLEKFLRTMNDFPTYSVGGIIGQILNTEKAGKDHPICKYLREDYL